MILCPDNLAPIPTGWKKVSLRTGLKRDHLIECGADVCHTTGDDHSSCLAALAVNVTIDANNPRSRRALNCWMRGDLSVATIFGELDNVGGQGVSCESVQDGIANQADSKTFHVKRLIGLNDDG